jgi:hypothetical protein
LRRSDVVALVKRVLLLPAFTDRAHTPNCEQA